MRVCAGVRLVPTQSRAAGTKGQAGVRTSGGGWGGEVSGVRETGERAESKSSLRTYNNKIQVQPSNQEQQNMNSKQNNNQSRFWARRQQWKVWERKGNGKKAGKRSKEPEKGSFILGPHLVALRAYSWPTLRNHT